MISMFFKMSKGVCRLCLGDQTIICNIFEHRNKNLIEKLKLYTSVELFHNDKIPNNVCLNCIDVVEQFDAFRTVCLKSNQIFIARYSNKSSPIRDTFRVSEEITSVDFDSDRELEEEIEDFRSKGQTFQINNSIREIIGENVYCCSICSLEFFSFFEFYDHQFSHNGNFVFNCSKCNEMFDSRQNLVDHESFHKIPCNVCKVEVLPKSMPAHRLIHTDIHRCSYCGVRHTSKASLQTHIKSRHEGEKGFVCHICGKQSSCQSSLNRHMGYHNTDRPYKCKFCSFNAKSLNIVQVHTSRKHFAEKCVCEICAKLFKSQPSLNQHMKRIHTTRKHVCNICNKAFIEKYNLSRHMKRHIGQRLHECKLCRKEFFTVRNLKEHMHSHREGCVKCPSCEKEFFYKKYYAKHILKCPDT